MSRLFLSVCAVLSVITATATSHFHHEYTGPWEWDDLTCTVTTSGTAGNMVTRYDCTIVITGYNGTPPTDLNIPSEIEWYSEDQGDGIHVRNIFHHDVVEIGYMAFSAYKNSYLYGNLKSVNIPSSVVKIGTFAFVNCTKLSSVTLQNGLLEIGNSAFYGCTGLSSVSIPNSVLTIGGGAFGGCKELQEVSLPSGLKNIGTEIFALCENLSNIRIPNTVTNIGKKAFAYSGLESIDLPPSVKSLYVSKHNTEEIYDGSFTGCSKLKNVIINGVIDVGWSFNLCPNITSLHFGSGVRSIASSPFYNTTKDGYPAQGPKNLTEVMFEEGVTNIGSSVFADSQITTLTLPESCIVIGDSAFSNCRALQSIFLPCGLQNIPDYMFGHCESLSSIEIPNSVTNIGDWAFEGSGLTSITLPTNVVTLGSGVFSFCYDLKAATINSVRDVDGSFDSLETLVLGSGVRNIRDYAFHGLPLRKLELGSGVTNIGEYAFMECTALKEVVIPRSLVKCGSGAFCECSALTNVELEDGLTILGESMFAGSGLTSIRIPASVKEIGSEVFYYCKQLGKVELDEGLERLSDSMFNQCKALSSIIIPKSVKEIGASCFASCSKLAAVKLESGVRLIGAQAFSGCAELKSIAIPGSVTNVGARAFSSNLALTNVSLSEGNEELSDYVFYGCVGLRAITFPESLRRIGTGTFSGCTALSTISFPSGVREVGAGAFSGCSVKSLLFDNPNGAFLDNFSKESLKTLFVGASANGIEGSLLADCTALETIMVAKNSSNYLVDDCGVLFDKGKTKLIKYPCAASHQSYTAPKTVKVVDDGAFAFASALQDIDFPASLTTVGESAFDWCLGLGSVSFPATLRTIGTGAFTTCPSLEDLYFEGNAPAIGDNQFWYSSPVFHVQENTTGWAAVAERFDVEVVIGEGSGGGDSPALTMDWLAQYPTLWSAAGGDLATAAKMTAANGLTLNECYIAGLDPTDPDSKFEARIDIVDGQPIVTWKPQLDKADAALRTYTTYGCSEIGGDWIDIDTTTPETKATLKFFKVSVDMK